MHNLNNRIFGVFFIILSLQSVSCGNKLPEEITGDTPSKEIVNLGDTAFSKGYYTRAGEYYLELNRFHPYSSLDGKALYKAVDAFYRAGKYEKTRFAVQKKSTEYAIYLILKELKKI